MFDTRDPRARAWEGWNPVESRRRVTLPDGREVRFCTEVTEVDGAAVSFIHRYTFPDEELTASATLRFRPEEELRASLGNAGFSVEQILGGWRREPVGEGDGEFLVIAQASATS